MEPYGRGSAAAEESSPDPPTEWSSPAGQAGLEEPMEELGLGDTDSYPERPDAADCIYFLRTGVCGYGPRCRFNHPRDRNPVVGAGRPRAGEHPERLGQPLCKYYMRTGSCKFGTSCKYHHPRQGVGSVSSVSLNYFGYPLRQGEKECSHYVRTGECKFGASCKFHHPQPPDVQLTPITDPAGPSVQTALYPPMQSPSGHPPHGVVPSNWQVARPPVVPGSFVQGVYGQFMLPHGMVSVPGWSTYQPPLSPAGNQPNVGATPYFGVTQLSLSAPAYTGPYSYAPMPLAAGPSSSSQKEQMFPERPGQPECQYYMKTGDCKFGSTCKYHHPPEGNALKADCAFSPMGLPLRPGEPHCHYYSQHGICKFGRMCKFDHPMGALNYSPSASSLIDMPVAPYPVGYSMVTLAPSSSSSNLRPELFLGPNDLWATRMSSSTSTTSGSVGPIFSKGGSISHAAVQHSSHSSSLSIGSSSTGHGGEA